LTVSKKYSISLNQQFRAAQGGAAKFHELVASSSNSMKFLTPAPLALFPEIAENRSTEYFLRIHQTCFNRKTHENH
jgi:hypothetical protein